VLLPVQAGFAAHVHARYRRDGVEAGGFAAPVLLFLDLAHDVVGVFLAIGIDRRSPEHTIAA